MRLLYSIGLALMVMAGGVQANDGRIKLAALDFPLVITNSGSYVLTESYVTTNVPPLASLIRVTARDVTLDLNGHSLRWAGSAGNIAGIQQTAGSGLRVRNGSLAGFQIGVVALAGCRIEEVMFTDMMTAFQTGPAATLRHLQILDSRSQNFPLVQAGPGSHWDRIQVNGLNTTNSAPTISRIESGSRVSNLQLTDMLVQGGSLVKLVAAENGSMLSGVHIHDVNQPNASVNGIEVLGGLIKDSSVGRLTSGSSNARGILLTRSLGSGLRVEDVFGLSGWVGFDVERSWLADSWFSSPAVAGRAVRAVSSRVARNSAGAGYMDAAATGTVLRDNHMATEMLYGMVLSPDDYNIAVRNSVSGSTGAMIFNAGLSNHHARVEAYPGNGFVITNNPWAHFQH
jgi:hypothetical protein